MPDEGPTMCPTCGARPTFLEGIGSKVGVEFAGGTTREMIMAGYHVSGPRDVAIWKRRRFLDGKDAGDRSEL